MICFTGRMDIVHFRIASRQLRITDRCAELIEAKLNQPLQSGERPVDAHRHPAIADRPSLIAPSPTPDHFLLLIPDPRSLIPRSASPIVQAAEVVGEEV